MYISELKFNVLVHQLTGLLRKKTETPPTRGAAGMRGRKITRMLPRTCTQLYKALNTSLSDVEQHHVFLLKASQWAGILSSQIGLVHPESEIYCAVTVVPNSKCCENICKHHHIIEKCARKGLKKMDSDQSG